ncbi:MAG: ATP-dependent helicase/nuclease subunit [bacterium]
MGPRLVPDVATLTPDDPVRVREWAHDGHTARVRVALNAPATVGTVLRLGAGAPGEQLAFALGDATEVPAGAGGVADRDGEGEPRSGASPRQEAAAASSAAAAAPRPPAPATLSYSSLAHYAACPYRFHLERGLGLPEQEPPAHLRDPEAPVTGLDPRVRGTLVHELLERLEGIPSATDVRAVAAAHDAELSDDDVADLLAMVVAFARSPLNARLAAAAEVRREHGFAFPLVAGGPLVNGVVDVLAREGDGAALVVDYKSDHVADADLEALVGDSYGVQRHVYALACLRAGAPAVEVVHVFLQRAAEPVTARYTAADAPALEQDLHGRAAGLLAGEHPVAAVPHRALCATCPGRAGLCSHPPERTDRTIEEALAG